MPDQPDISPAGPSKILVASFADDGLDSVSEEFPMLEDSLAMTPWERFLANDDTQNFGASLRAAMERRNAKPD